MSARVDRAIVLRLFDYSETSQVAALFSRAAGLVRLLAKGARRATKKRVSVGLDLLELGEVGYSPARGEAGLGVLTDWQQFDGFDGLRKSLDCIYSGLYAAELVSVLTQEHDPHPELFDALLELLTALDEPLPRPVSPDAPLYMSALHAPASHVSAAGIPASLPAVVRFQRQLLEAIGFLPEMRACVVCGRPRSATLTRHFSSSAGGLLCSRCQGSVGEKRSVPAALMDDEQRVRAAAEWFDVLDYHLMHIAGRPFEGGRAVRAMVAVTQPLAPAAPPVMPPAAPPAAPQSVAGS